MNNDLKKILLITTGGTIAGTGIEGTSIGYNSGAVSGKTVLNAMPALKDIANIEQVELCNINSDDITSLIWIKLANLINERTKDNDIDGFVITHGTDTMEETAYFLHLTVKTDKPVILTGAMYPMTALSYDGYMNLYQAIKVATEPKSYNRGVMVVFSNKIISARYVTKVSTHLPTAIASTAGGELGTVLDDEVIYHCNNDNNTRPYYDVNKLVELKKVNITYFHAEADVSILKYIADISDGLVIAGAGMGEYSKEYINAIAKIDKVVLVSSRIGDDLVAKNSLLNENVISAGDLSPQKAAVLLRVLLSVGYSKKEIADIIYNRRN